MAATPVSPKVTAGANWATYATLGLTILDGLTPDTFAFLGRYAPLAYGAVVGASYALGAYLKADPLRAPAAAADPSTVVDELAKRLATPTTN